MKNEKVVLICESTGTNLDVVDKNNYRLEGIFAVFDKENNNHRIYEWNEYKPHMNYLQDQIKKNKLVGELDHPDKFDISLQNVSHIVEKLWYDEKENVLKGQIRLLDTDPNGMNARKLLDAGFPLGISSRAAGTVQENKKVRLNKVFTYDLVCSTGFQGADLERITESVGFNPEDYSKEPTLTLLNESLGIDNNNIKVYDVTDQYPEYLTGSEIIDQIGIESYIKQYIVGERGKDRIKNESEIYNKNNAKNMKDTSNFVSIDEMHKYSLHVKEEVSRIDKTLQSISESISKIVTGDDTSKDEKILALEKEISKLRKDSLDLSEKMSTVYKWSEEISKDHNYLVEYTEKIAEDHNHLVNYAEKIAEDHNYLTNYTEKIAEDHNYLANYAEKIAEDHNYVASYVDDKIRPLLENTINYAEMVAEKANIGMNYVEDVIVNELHKTQEYVNDVLVEKLNVLWNYSEYLGEKANEVTSYAEYLGENAATKEDLESVIGYTELVAESVKSLKVNESKNTTINENATVNRYTSLNEKIDNLLHSIKTEKINENKFLGNLTNEQQKRFINFTDVQKEQFEKSLNPAMNQEQIQMMFESISTPKILSNEERWLAAMPENVKPLWESVTPELKERIFRNAQLYNFNNDYAVKHYWNSKISLLGGQNDTTLIKESTQNELEDEKVKTLGYGSDYIKSIFEKMGN